MIDAIEFLDELKELKALYNSGDLRNFDFERMIQKYERQVEQYESAMDAAFKESAFYDPFREV
jgi:hypothetical protein